MGGQSPEIRILYKKKNGNPHAGLRYRLCKLYKRCGEEIRNIAAANMRYRPRNGDTPEQRRKKEKKWQRALCALRGGFAIILKTRMLVQFSHLEECQNPGTNEDRK